MRRILALTIVAGMATASIGLTGCQNDASNNDNMRREQILNPVGAEGGGMNRTGAGASEGASASGLDRSGGGLAGTHGANSGSTGAGPTPTTRPTGASGLGATR